MARAYGARARMALAFESVYGTPPGAGWRRMPFVRSGLGGERGLVADDLLGHGRDPRDPIPDAEVVEGEIEIPMDAEALGAWLKALFGAPITTGTGPYVHEFRSGGWDLPSFAVEIGMPDVPHYALNAGCKAESLSWTMARSGQLTATVSVVGRAETIAAVSGAGTPADWTHRRFGHVHGALTRNGAALGALGDLVGASFTYANNLDRIEAVGDGGRIAGADPTVAALTGSMEVRFASQALLQQAVDGTPCEIVVTYAHPSGESLAWTIHRVFLPRPRAEISGPGGVQATFDWRAAHDPVAGRMATVVLSNDVPDYDA
ncbi:MAG: phage tail tube protein [Paracoccaceae bacterium]